MKEMHTSDSSTNLDNIDVCKHGDFHIIDTNYISLNNKLYFRKSALVKNIANQKLRRKVINEFSTTKYGNKIIKFTSTDSCNCYQYVKSNCRIKGKHFLFIRKDYIPQAYEKYLNKSSIAFILN